MPAPALPIRCLHVGSSPVLLPSVPMSRVVGIYCRVTNCPKTEWCKGTTFTSCSFAIWAGLCLLHMGSPGWAGGSVLAGGLELSWRVWLAPSVPSTWPLGLPRSMLAEFPERGEAWTRHSGTSATFYSWSKGQPRCKGVGE